MGLNDLSFTTTTDTTSNWSYIPTMVDGQEYAIKIDGDMSISGKIDSKQWEELEKEVNKLKEANKMAQMGLFEVYVVDAKKGKLLIHNDIVAKNEDKAKLRVAMGHGTDIPDDVEFFVRCIGTWESRKPKEVKIVKE